MKETSGEFSMTVVVIVGAIIIVGLLVALGPVMGKYIGEQWNGFTGQGEDASENAQNALEDEFDE